MGIRILLVTVIKCTVYAATVVYKSVKRKLKTNTKLQKGCKTKDHRGYGK